MNRSLAISDVRSVITPQLMLICMLITAVGLMLTPNTAKANSKYASLVIDANTGVVLSQDYAGKRRHPASLTKMMTLYLTFQALEKGELTMGKRLKVSSRAAGQPPSKIGLKRGQRIKVRDAVLAAIVKSANDATVVLAEAISGTEWQFATTMNRMAKRLGMHHTNFKNASGLHHRKQYSTAYDMARLAVALKRDYPQYYHLFKRTSFSYKGRNYRSHNKVTRKYRGADGLKTGYIRAAGYNLVTSAQRGDARVIGVVMGGRSGRTRDRHMIKILDRGFIKLAKANPGSYRIYAGKVPLPKLKKSTRMRMAALSRKAPLPSQKPVTRLEYTPTSLSSSEFGNKNSAKEPYAKRNGRIIRGRFVPMPMLKEQRFNISYLVN